jgi:FAD/FMN-containing dehydrogenase
MDRMLQVDPLTRLARVQPGVLLDRLRDETERFDLTFAPNQAAHTRCTLGGMIGNNFYGVHALIGGKTVHNVESLGVLLYDDPLMQVARTTEQESAKMITAGERKRLEEHSLSPAVRAAAPEDTLISNGFSCREQIKRNSTRRALHRAEVLLGVCQ